MEVNSEVIEALKESQKYEITEHTIYTILSNRAKKTENRELLMMIGLDELKHYNILKKYTKVDAKPIKFLVIKYSLIARFLGITFALKLLERGENRAQINYSNFIKDIPEIREVIKEEDQHEISLINKIDENRVKYISSMVLGLNDALVEISGTLVGLTFALRDTKQIALAGLITGIAASLSMASSELLARRSDNDSEAFTASLFTGGAYVGAVGAMIVPYLFLKDYLHAFIVSNFVVVFIILFFNVFISVVKDKSFKKSFFEMLAIVASVSVISFFAGILLKKLFNI